MPGGPILPIPTMNDGDSGQHLMDDIFNVIINRLNAVGSWPVGQVYSSVHPVTIPGLAGESSVFETPGFAYGDLTFLPNFFKESTEIRVRIKGLYTNAGGTLAAAVKIKLGGSTVVNKSLAALNNGTDELLDIEFTIKCETPGGAGDLWVIGEARYGQGNDAAMFSVNLTTTTSFNKDTTAALPFDVTLTPAGGGGGDSIKIISTTIEKLNLNA